MRRQAPRQDRRTAARRVFSPRRVTLPGVLIGLVAGLLLVGAPIRSAAGAPPNAGADASSGSGPDGNALVRAAFDHYRGKASTGTAEMTIHRPSWERSMTMDIWTEGDAQSLVRITAPAKDEGNGTLKKGQDMWLFNPKVNRTIKLPPSMMSQSWMGSDFSNNDLAKTDSLVNDYDHRVTSTDSRDGHTVYTIQSTPHPGAPVVWGSLELEIRDDHVLLAERFYDEDGALVKTLTGSDIKTLGGRILPATLRMQKADKDGEWTELHYTELSFQNSLPDRLFTLTNLRNPSS